MYLTVSLYANIFCHLHIVPKKLGGGLAMTILADESVWEQKDGGFINF